MNTAIKTDDVIFNFFKQICDEKDDQKCVELGKEWVKAMNTNLSSMEANLNGAPFKFASILDKFVFIAFTHSFPSSTHF